jgi:hypothetical protein
LLPSLQISNPHEDHDKEDVEVIFASEHHCTKIVTHIFVMKGKEAHLGEIELGKH